MWFFYAQKAVIIIANIKGLTIEINGETTGLTKALSGVNKTSKSLQTELRQVEKLLKLDPTNTELLAQKEQILAESIETAKEKLDTLKTAAEQAQEKLASGDIGEDQFRALQREVITAEQRLQSLTSAQSDFQNAANNSADDVDDLSDSLDNADRSALSFKDVLGADVLADGISAIGSAAKDAAGNIINLAAQTDSATGMIQAKLGLTEDEAKKFTSIAKSVWSDGFGENVDDVVSNLAIVRQYLGDMSDDEMKSALENAYTISDVFGADVNESIKAVKTMMDNFGISSSDAFDLITSGYQNGLDYSDEFLDTLNEYSPQFKAMGLSAQDAMIMMKNGVDAGAFSLDKVADGMKEFNLRIKDGSDSTAEGLQYLGLNVNDITSKLADGSMTTSQAMKLVVDALNNTDDSVTQNLAGVDLFGTQWEDVGKDVILSLENVNSSIGNVENSTKEASDAAYNNLGANFKETIRGLQEAFAPLAEQILDFVNNIMPKIQSGIQWISDHGKELVTVITSIIAVYALYKVASIALNTVTATMNSLEAIKAARIALSEGATLAEVAATETATGAQVGYNTALLTSIASTTASIIKMVAQKTAMIASTAATNGMAIAQRALNIVMSANPIGIVITLLASLTAALVVLYNKNKAFRDFVNKMWSEIKGAWSKVISGIKEEWNKLNPLQWGKDLIDSIVSGIKSGINKVKKAGGAVATAISNLLHHSSPEEGPMKDDYKWMPDFMNLLASGITGNMHKVVNAAAGVAQSIATKMTTGLADNIDDNADLVEKSAENLVTLTENKITELNSSLESITDDTQKSIVQGQIDSLQTLKDSLSSTIDEIGQEENSLSSKLSGLGTLLTSGTDSAGNDIDQLTDLSSTLDTIKQYADTVKKLKARGVSASILNYVLQMDPENAITAANLLLNLSDSEWNQEMAEWDEIQSLSESVAKSAFTDDLKKGIQDDLSSAGYSAGSSFMNSLVSGISDSVSSVKTAAASVVTGVQSVAGNISSSIGSTGLSATVQSLPSTVSYAVTPVTSNQSDQSQDLMQMISTAVSTALVSGFAAVGDSIYEAIPKEMVMNVDGQKFARTTWDDFSNVGANKNRYFAPNRETIIQIARSLL